MNDFDNFTKKAKLVLFRIVEVLALTVAILLLLYLLLGEASGNYVTSVAVNVSLFISAVTPEALAAVALGANMIEKHYTISRDWEGPDNIISIEPNELKDLVIQGNEIFNGRG